MNKLSMAMVEVVLGCNLSCGHCPVGKWSLFGGRKPIRMTMDTFEKVLSQLPDDCQVHLGVMGEPTLNPDFMSMAELSVSQGRPTFTTTNATKLHLMDLPRLKRLMTGLTVSMDGWDESYSAHRSGCEWDVVLSNVHSLIRADGDCDIVVASIESDFTKGDVYRAKDYWENLGVKFTILPLDDYCGQLDLPPGMGKCRTRNGKDWSGPRKPCELIGRCIHVNPLGRAFTCCHDLRNDIPLRGINDPGGLVSAWEEDMSSLRGRHERLDFPFPCSDCSMTIP